MAYKYGVAVGLKNVYFAPLVTDDQGVTTYDAPFKIGDTITVKPTFEFAEGSLEADDVTIRDDAELIGITYQINTTRFAPEIEAKILGHRIDANGGIVMADGDTPPEGALLYQKTLDNGKNKYVCVFKGVFKDFAEESQTKQRGSKNYQTPTIEYSSYRREDGLLKYEMSEEAVNYSATAAAQWFTAVPEPVAATATPK